MGITFGIRSYWGMLKMKGPQCGTCPFVLFKTSVITSCAGGFTITLSLIGFELAISFTGKGYTDNVDAWLKEQEEESGKVLDILDDTLKKTKDILTATHETIKTDLDKLKNDIDKLPD